ncbi:HlyD family efflux transporter periplasmic adaptor subunit [Sulfitobacter sp. M57]|uniref:HlyD family secretion protein n=1 Tax=unclassified Sulfitobacter TaxID=196795 RepID=UPI0023E13624|nr:MULTISPECIES: efflux RND transporter periplasmic adaptor subunit [unclassified Sulfitobacter]MDF3414583.1 HlyD family efflux transporter periplasmic adaptor subunit [Sulfitobacter sp. KE5]MDF3422065.1 HlyD family efflux transporter periplasmic adaptor subunit [Sulfitobacter sp. KE43]MDF3433130.1 HlyD family efflux transporter periplasmic adaptor subunit [Sulfitobacter sp. KE42]MDF3458770.1 HlyD family efflux transporter periplasmic adaptor subunit [Sulfitobacter sp. S74]MDF3462669.1 HlyD fa
MKTTRNAILAVLAVLAVAALLIWTLRQPTTYLVQGEVEATRIDLSAQVTARVAQTPVSFGDRIRAGDVVVQLHSPQLLAQLSAAQAGVGVAQANRDLAFSTRPETIAAAEAQLAKAVADVELAQSNFDRINKLRADSVVSQANFDRATNTLDAAVQAQAAAQANLDQARNGTSAEQKAVATAQVTQAEANLAQLQANVDELTVTSPIDGQVTTRTAEVGKLFSAGAPLISIVDVDHAWFTFNLREDLLQGLEIGQPLEIRVPALGQDHAAIPARITAINVEGSYANWRATKATGDFDLRTFSVRAQPVEPIVGLRPGMSALVDWSTTNRNAD